MSVSGILARGRALAARLSDSEVTVRRAGEPARNPITGKIETTWTQIYQGPGRLRFSNGQPREGDQLGQRFSDQSPTLSLPIEGTGHIRVDDVAEISENPFDPGGESLKLRITGLHVQTHSTARRLPVEVLNFS